MKSKQTKAKAKGRPMASRKFSLIELGPNVTTRKLTPTGKRNFKWVGDMVEAGVGEMPTAVLPYLTLHAGNTKVTDKGWLNAINCRNMFAEGPNIDFIPQESFGGKIEVWMENVQQNDSFHVQFRVTCGYNGNWEVSSSETAKITIGINPVQQSIDLFIPPVNTDYGLVLIALEAVFNNGGSWVFHDVIINKLSY
jgi:hypothetical protein